MTDAITYDLLDKNELMVTEVDLDDVDLGVVAQTIAETIDLNRNEVLVTDYLNRVLTVDVLRPDVYPHQILGRNAEILERLAAVPGVLVGPAAQVYSQGMLGWIAADPKEAEQSIRRAEDLARRIHARVNKRVLIFSTGAEVAEGQVRDTNRIALSAALEADGFSCDHGGVLRDDIELISGAIRTATARGYGVVITTGGVGAESKDCTVEAVLRLDPQAHTPFLCHFEPGHGRHVKTGVRIAVAMYHGSWIISLPGPNEEVRAAVPVLRAALAGAHDPAQLAEELATTLRGVLHDRMARRDS